MKAKQTAKASPLWPSFSQLKKILVAGQRLSALTGAQVKDLLPDPTTFMHYISRNVDKVYELRKKQLVDWCHLIDEFCITVDFWSAGHTGIHFGGVSLYHIDHNNELYVFILGCYPYDEGDQKAPTIRAFVEKCLEE
ncbi:unnamed protein product [Adineta ricciae]|uniref:Transposase n=1 Tax=Adineta ricciae TaxID=249248 RepID=A0A815G1Q0_ADIRI|nr:unnamed protein product [Adineta ricciae]